MGLGDGILGSTFSLCGFQLIFIASAEGDWSCVVVEQQLFSVVAFSGANKYCMCVCMYVYVCACRHLCVCAQTQELCVGTHLLVGTCMCVYIHVCTCTYSLCLA